MSNKAHLTTGQVLSKDEFRERLLKDQKRIKEKKQRHDKTALRDYYFRKQHKRCKANGIKSLPKWV